MKDQAQVRDLMQGHTPGPWTVEESATGQTLICGAGKLGRMMLGTIRPGNPAESAANANLIASAPDLLAACEDFMRLFNRDDVPDLQFESSAGDAVYVAVLRTTADRLKAAIAKAKGES